LPVTASVDGRENTFENATKDTYIDTLILYYQQIAKSMHQFSNGINNIILTDAQDTGA